MGKTAKADVIPVRQQNQYNCVSTSLAMALRALGVPEDECSPARVNKVVGAMPLQGAAWEPMLAAANHYGMRATLTLPSTVRQLKSWTDEGTPVVIAWNPEGREWSHASLVFDVTEDEEHGFMVHIADPNIPDPDETVRVVPKKEFYSKWYEKSPQGYLIRRPACAIQHEITADGRQVMASRRKTAGVVSVKIWDREYYKVDGTGRNGLTLTPITYSFDQWEYIGEDGGVLVSWGDQDSLMDRREFASFAADMKKAIAWAENYDYSKGKTAKKKTTPVSEKKDKSKIKVKGPTRRNEIVQGLIERGSGGSGKHTNKAQRGSGKGSGKPGRHPKHKSQNAYASAARVATMYLLDDKDKR